MSDSHLKSLRSAIERRGWAIEELPGDDYAVSATWRITRGQSIRLHIDFDGLDDMQTLPIQSSYGCVLRESRRSLYFNRIGGEKADARTKWKAEMNAFVSALDATGSGADRPA